MESLSERSVIRDVDFQAASLAHLEDGLCDRSLPRDLLRA